MQTREAIRSTFSKIFAGVFPTFSGSIIDSLTAADVNEWDSVSHIDLICEIESEFSIEFTTAEISQLQNVGELITLVLEKTGS